ncbi:MAG: hypothetical protein M3Y26_00245 [Actinomycetota bacterium]|nr:hypothetical protein [Actinomycetota bacterium]
MSPEDDQIEASFRRLSAAVDDTWQRWRESRASRTAREQAEMRQLVDTLSDSLAEPEPK